MATADDDNDVAMSTKEESTKKESTIDNTNNANNDKDQNESNTNNENIDNTNKNENENKAKMNIEETTNDNDDNEEKKEYDKDNDGIDISNSFGMNPLMLVQSAMSDFLNEMSAADIKATTLYQTHIEKQQKLMNRFVADSLRLMHEFNTGLSPIHNVLKKLKAPLQDVLLNQFISIPCDHLEEISKKQMNTRYNKTWGVSPLTHQYNQKNGKSENPHLKEIDLGPQIKSLRDSVKASLQSLNDNNNNNDQNNDSSQNKDNDKNDKNDKDESNKDDSNKKDDDQDSVMKDNATNNDSSANNDKDNDQNKNSNANDKNNNENNNNSLYDENDLYNQAVMDYLSDPSNVTTGQTDLVLKFFNTSRAEQQRLEIKLQEKARKEAEKQQQKEQREGGAAMLLSVLPWLTMDQAMVVMEMKSDIIEQATNYCMSTDPADLFLAINEWKKSHPTTTLNNNNNKNDKDGDINMLSNNNTMLNTRSSMDQRVLVRSQTTGESKCVIFRCSEVSDDGQIKLQAVLDRNNIPLDPMHAKLLYISVSDLMNCPGVTIEAQQRVEIAQNERVLSIVFQVVKEQQTEMELMQQYAQQLLNQTTSSWRSRANYNKQAEFVPIQFQPKCRDLEYELEFEEKTPPNNSCLKSVKHRMDGPVLFRGIYDDGTGLGLVGSAVNQPIEIYTQIIDDVTHNIICIIFENDLRDNVVIDVKNLSFTDQTLKDIITDSEKDFTKKDAAGNKISYRIIVKDKKIIGVLTKFGNEIKEMPYIEHSWMKEGDLVKIPSRNMLGIVKTIPIGLIVTNDPHKNIEKKSIKYTKNVNSRIFRKHCADLEGFVDIDIVKEGSSGGFRQIDNPLCQSFAVTDIKPSDDTDLATFLSFKQQNDTNMTDEINNLMKNVENDFNLIKNKDAATNTNNNESPADLLNRAINTVKQIQELLSTFKTRKSSLNDEETKFAQIVNDNLSKYNREIRALRFEVKMSGNNNASKQ